MAVNESFKKLISSVKFFYSINQKDIALALGVANTYLSDMINGRVPVTESIKSKIYELYSDVNKEDSNNVKETNQKISKSDVRIKNYDNEIEIFTNKNDINFYIYPDDSIQIEVFKVPYKAYASYVEAYTDEVRINKEFPKVTFKVDKVGKGNYLAFETVNDSMNGGGIDDTPGGADILCREVGRHLWKDGFRQTKYGMVLLTKKAIYHKDITNYNEETGMLTLSSRNPENECFEISINDVFQIFNVIKRTF